MSKNSKISLYVDTLIVEAAISNDIIIKNAQGDFLSAFTDSALQYFKDHIDPKDTTNSVLKILTPGALFLAFRSLGFNKIGWLLALASAIFRVNVPEMLSYVCEKIGSIISGGKKTSSSEVDSIVSTAVSASTPATEPEHVASALEKLRQGNFSPLNYFSASADDGLFSENSVEAQLRVARRIKLAIIHYESSLSKISNLESYATPTGSKESFTSKVMDFINPFSKKKAETNSILVRVISYFCKLLLASAGFMVAGDIINSVIGRSNALDRSLQEGKPVPGSGKSDDPTKGQQIPGSTRGQTGGASATTQNKFPIKPGYVEESLTDWTENYMCNKYNIESMVIDFANDVYSGLEDKESIIRSSPGFRAVIERILFHNRDNIGHNMIFIPDIYHSKKEIADSFINDVARKS